MLYELGARLIEAKQRYVLTVLHASVDYHLQRLNYEAQVTQLKQSCSKQRPRPRTGSVAPN